MQQFSCPEIPDDWMGWGNFQLLHVLQQLMGGRVHHRAEFVGIYGQESSGPFPDLAELLFKARIDAMSFNANAAMKTTMRIA